MNKPSERAMKQRDYSIAIDSKVPPEETRERIGRISEWWTSGFRGTAQQIGDAFSVHFGDTFVDFKVVELGGARVVWRATNCNLAWIKNKTEWTGTEVVWEISADRGKTTVRMTHKGLVPQAECYDDCERGWTFYVGESLRKLLADGEGLPDREGRQGRS